MMRETATSLRILRCRDNSASLTMPMATHSPCRICGVKMASIACPIEWPQLSRPRKPPSLSSAETTWALKRAEARILFFRISCISSKRPLAGFFFTAVKIAPAWFSNAVNSFSSDIAAVYTGVSKPELSSVLNSRPYRVIP